MDPQARRLRDFLKFQPTYFYGGGNPEAAGDWIVSHQRLHKELNTEERHRARLSGTCFRSDAAVWWTNYQETHADPATWAEFREIFYDQFIPMEVRLRLREEFLSLRQGNRTMLQYMDRYRYLLQFSMDIAGTERLQIYYFVRGLRR
ncbi:hypothetical protein Sjap_000508 [Stephania japonica]|uniref:Retrotransposon gag domain-containing protein n=1 Tax=Stephania japonica TaxID=461633 RepID=A0AAP0KI59_9MAGN